MDPGVLAAVDLSRTHGVPVGIARARGDNGPHRFPESLTACAARTCASDSTTLIKGLRQLGPGE